MKCNCGWMCVSALGLMVAAGVATTLRADPTDKKAPPTDPGMQMTKAMEKCMELGTPGEQHKKMAGMVGTWNADLSMWMDGKQTEPMKSTGVTVYKAVFEGRYITGDFTGEMGGSQFKGMEIFGYNNAAQQFESVWFDSMSTGMMFQTGTPSADGKTCTLKAEMKAPTEPDAKIEVVKFRTVITHTDHDHFTMEMFAKEPSKNEFRMMKIDYTRAAVK